MTDEKIENSCKWIPLEEAEKVKNTILEPECQQTFQKVVNSINSCDDPEKALDLGFKILDKNKKVVKISFNDDLGIKNALKLLWNYILKRRKKTLEILDNNFSLKAGKSFDNKFNLRYIKGEGVLEKNTETLRRMLILRNVDFLFKTFLSRVRKAIEEKEVNKKQQNH